MSWQFVALLLAPLFVVAVFIALLMLLVQGKGTIQIQRQHQFWRWPAAVLVGFGATPTLVLGGHGIAPVPFIFGLVGVIASMPDVSVSNSGLWLETGSDFSVFWPPAFVGAAACHAYLKRRASGK